VGVSVLVELTQFTGNRFLYPCPYRITDVSTTCSRTASGRCWVRSRRRRSPRCPGSGRERPTRHRGLGAAVTGTTMVDVRASRARC